MHLRIISGFCSESCDGSDGRQSGSIRMPVHGDKGGRSRSGRCESIWLFKRVVTSSKTGLWDEVAVTQIGSLTSPYLPVCAMAASGLLSCLQSLPRILRTIITPSSRTPLRGEPPVHLATLNSLFLSLCSGSILRSFTFPNDITRLCVSVHNEPVKFKSLCFIIKQ